MDEGPFVRVFGGMAVDDGGQPVSIGGPRQRRLLALLVVRSNTVVGNDWLAENLWQDDERPEVVAPAIRTYISRLRLALPEAAQDWIQTESAGYRWVGPAEALEHRWFANMRQLATAARVRDDPASAHRTLCRALASWRGDPFRELEDLDWARAEIEQLRLDRLEMQEERWEAALALGRHTQITGELAAFTATHGLRDRAARQYALALYRSGRTAEALRVLDDHRRNLAEASGLDPSAAVLELEQAIFSGDPSLEVGDEGRRLRGYRLIEQAGAGAFAVVWRGYQPSVDRQVAIKQIRAELASRPDFIRRFETEAHLVARLQHPHVVPLIDFWRDPDSAYLVMRWLSGGTLEQRLSDGPLTVEATLTLARQIGSALSAAHRNGVVHGDVKSSNILFDDDGHAYLTDFGIAFEAKESAPAQVAASPGSPAYASPEQRQGKPVGPESDVYSFGVVLFECLTGVLPFGDRIATEEIDASLTSLTPRDIEPMADVPSSIVEAMGKAMAPSPDNRFGSVDELLLALESRSVAIDVNAGRTVDSIAGAKEVTNPYKGLQAFHDADADEFFGRDSLVAELVARLGGNSAGARCLVIVGPSGSGKSSVVRAGLLPALRTDAIVGSSRWFATTMRPGPDPFESLEAALLRIAVNPPASLVDQLRDGERGVVRGVRRCLPSDEDVAVLVIDQFEEVFTNSSTTDAHRFLDALSAATADPTSPLRLVATLRADYYHRPLEHPGFAPLLKQAAVDVTPLTPEELEQVIVEPARRRGVGFEPGLVARIVADTVGQPSPLPLLQYSLSELFDRRAGTEITTAGYEALGGLSGALAARAESLYGGADSDQQAATRRVFGQLTNPGEEAADLRRRVPIVDLGDDPAVEGVLEEYGAARLLSFDRHATTREPTVEVAHEALLREWPRVVGWLHEDRDILRQVDSVAAAANVWEQGGQEDSDLVRGARLESATGLIGSADDRLRPVDRRFIEASRSAANAEQRKEERRVRRLRGLVAGIGAALVVALVAGAVAIGQRNDAQAAAAEAEVVGLISRSAAVADDDPDLSILLALEAHRRQPGTETERAVLDALSSNTVANRLSTLDPPFAGSANTCPATIVYPGAAVEFSTFDGQLISRDPLTGVVTEHGAAPVPCVFWFGDEQADRRIAVSFDGMRAWFGPFDGPWDLEREFDEPTFPCPMCAFNEEHRMLVVSDRNDGAAVLLLDDVSGQQVGAAISAGGPVVTGTLSEDGSLAAVAFASAPGSNGNGAIVVVDGRTGDELHRLELEASDLAFDGATGELLAGTPDGAIVSIDSETGQVLSTVETSARSVVLDVGVRSDGLLVASSGDRVDIIDRRIGPIGSPVELPDIGFAELRADGTVLTSNRVGSKLEIYALAGNALADRVIDLVEPSFVTYGSGSAVAIGVETSAAAVIDLITGDTTPLPLTAQEGVPFEAAVAAADSGGFIAVSADAAVARWTDGRMTERVDTADELGVMTLGLDVILAEQAAALNLESGRLLLVRQRPDGERDVVFMSIEPDEMEVLSTVETDRLVSPAVAPDGGFYTLHDDGILRSYNAGGTVTGELQTGFVQSATTGAATALDVAGRKVAFGAPSGAFILETTTGHVTVVPTFGSLTSLTFARDGELLAIGSADGSVRLWDVEQQVSRGVLWRGSHAIQLGSWYEEQSDSVWVVSQTQLIRLPLDPAVHLRRACEIVGRDFTQEEWDRFVPGGGRVQSACATDG